MSKAILSSALAATYEACCCPQPTPEAAAVILADLAEYADDAVLAALSRCRRELYGRLSLAAIIDRIAKPASETWPTPNEAWAMVGTTDERRTLVCVSEALSTLAEVRQLLAQDEVAARMAFIDGYKRRVETAKAENRKPMWKASLGWDPDGRAASLAEAVSAGRLPRDYAEGLLGTNLPSGTLPAPGAGLRVLTGERDTKQPPAAGSSAGPVRPGDLLGSFTNPDLARKMTEERRRKWCSTSAETLDEFLALVPEWVREAVRAEVPAAEVKTDPARIPIAFPEPDYRPPTRAEVAAMRRAQLTAAEQEAAMSDWDDRRPPEATP